MLSQDLIDRTYQYFLEDEGLVEPTRERKDLTFNEKAVSEQVGAGELKLKQIKNIRNVNALTASQDDGGDIL